MKGSPRKCDEFYCYDNELTSLKGAPDQCEYFSCWGNKLTSLKGAPKSDYIGADYYKLNLDNEELYVIEALDNYFNYYNSNKELKDYLKIRQRNNLIDSILD